MKKETKTMAQQINWDFETNGDLEIKDKDGNPTYYEYSNGYWIKWELDFKGNRIYYENLNSKIIYNRPKPCENKVV